jgi:Tfp pilus assembly protein PilO
MRKLTKLESFGLISAILVSGSFFYMKKVYDPEAESLKKTVTKLNQTIAEYNKLEEPPNLDSLQKEIEKQTEQMKGYTAELKAAGGRTDEPSEVTEVLAEISRLAKKENMLVLKITRDKDEKDELFNWAAVNIQIQGQYQDFVALIQRLKELRKPVQLLKLHIEQGKEEWRGDIIITAKLLV